MRRPARTALFLCLAALSVRGPGLAADELSSKQRAAAEANLKKIGAEKVALVETDNLIVCAPLAPAKAKAVADALQKTFATARKALQYEPKEQAFKGKLTVYAFTERRPFTQFMLQVAGEKTKETHHFALRAEEPYVVAGVEVGEKVMEADLAEQCGKLVAAATLMAKGGAAAYPDWARMGFGRAASLRADGPASRRMLDFKAKAKPVVLGGKGLPPATLKDVWSGDRSKEGALLEASLMDFLAFGPRAAEFPKFANGFRPSETVPEPTADQVLEGMAWKAEELEKAWRKYVQTGK